jgi:hypothetical protein
MRNRRLRLELAGAGPVKVASQPGVIEPFERRGHNRPQLILVRRPLPIPPHRGVVREEVQQLDVVRLPDPVNAPLPLAVEHGRHRRVVLDEPLAALQVRPDRAGVGGEQNVV